jgi:hypothetical protein
MSRLRRAGRATSVVGSIGAVAGLLVLGGVLGRSMIGTQSQPPADQSYGYRPPPGPPPEPVSGASDHPTGHPRITVNQPFGDGNTIFIVHGTGWTPGQHITVRLLGSRPSPATPVVDRSGGFNYAVNQNHEFFPGALPPGVHRIVVAPYGGGPKAQADFNVQPVSP